MGPNQQILEMRKKGLMFTRRNPCSACGFALIIALSTEQYSIIMLGVSIVGVSILLLQISCETQKYGLLCVTLISAEMCIASFLTVHPTCYSRYYVSIHTIP